MLVAVIGDIHGNSVALKSVLSDAKKLGVEELWVLGDLVGYYYSATEVFDLLSEWKIKVIKGNHEQMLIDLKNKTLDNNVIRPKYGSGIAIALESLGDQNLSEILAYPSSSKIEVDGLAIGLCHGSLHNENEYIYPDATDAQLRSCEDASYQFIFMGHTHYPLFYSGKVSTLINPGSVGQSRVKGGIADWGIFRTSNGVFSQRHSSYDISTLMDEVKKRDPDVPYLAEVLLRA